MSRLTLQPVTRANVQAAFRLGALPEQQHFVCDYTPIAAIALAKGFVGTFGMRWLPFAFYLGDEMVGFVTLAYRPEQSHVYWMFHFFIDARFQGHGYGKEALEVLIQEVEAHHPACQVIQLTVHPENVVAQHRYAQVGFLPTGDKLEGGPLYQLQRPR